MADTAAAMSLKRQFGQRETNCRNANKVTIISGCSLGQQLAKCGH